MANLIIGDLDTSAGITFCGGEDIYLEILREYVNKGEDNFTPVEEAFQNQDWKNYIILVHAVKSSMRTIGANGLSELAKELEFAGKEGRISDILDKHAPMMKEFRRVMGQISDALATAQKDEEMASWLPGKEYTKDEIEECLLDFENAAFCLEEERMLELLGEMERNTYCGVDLSKAVSPIEQKVKRGDYMAALNVLRQTVSRMGQLKN